MKDREFKIRGGSEEMRGREGARVGKGTKCSSNDEIVGYGKKLGAKS